MNGDSDETLMLRYARGNGDAFDTLYERYRKPLYAYCLRHVNDATLANDLYQGCWEKVIAARRRYSTRAPFRAWLFRIAHNHIVDHYRARRPESALPPDMVDESATQPADAMDAALRQERFRRAVATLPAEQRDALLLRLEAGLGLEEIAEATGVGAETAKSRLRYATRKLKEVLGP